MMPFSDRNFKMKILIVGFTKLKYMPYINFYLESIEHVDADVHILYWNRDLKSEDLDRFQKFHLHEFKNYLEDESPKISKILSFLKYKKYAEHVIKSNSFDFIIVLHSMPAILLKHILRSRFKNRYIFDYRDYTYEKIFFYRNIISQTVKNSVATFVSSDGFRRYLPKKFEYKIYTSHNILTDSLNYRNIKKDNLSKSDKIRISFWGFIRNADINKALIDRISRDSRFELHYYGRKQKTALDLEKYSIDCNAKNVFFHGEYIPEDRYKFVRDTDLIHNIYNDYNMMSAMANKYYDGAFFYIPQLCMRESYMGQRAVKNEIGFECSPYDDDFTDKVFEYYTTLNQNKFYLACDKETERVKSEYESGREIIQKICSG